MSRPWSLSLQTVICNSENNIFPIVFGNVASSSGHKRYQWYLSLFLDWRDWLPCSQPFQAWRDWVAGGKDSEGAEGEGAWCCREEGSQGAKGKENCAWILGFLDQFPNHLWSYTPLAFFHVGGDPNVIRTSDNIHVSHLYQIHNLYLTANLVISIPLFSKKYSTFFLKSKTKTKNP